MNTRDAVDGLLEQYRQYRKLDVQIAAHKRLVAHQKAIGTVSSADMTQLAKLQREQSTLSDAMTFDSPLIWVMYKFEAYQDAPQPIRTLHDFRLHCSKPDYICTKRWMFVNQWRRHMDLVPFSDVSSYPDEVELPVLYDELEQLASDERFMVAWRNYEYYQADGVVGKWQNFTEFSGSSAR